VRKKHEGERTLERTEESSVVICPDVVIVKVDCISVIIWLFFALEGQFVIFQREGLAGFCSTFCSAIAEIDLQSPEPFVPF
jgi:hypothetical protein